MNRPVYGSIVFGCLMIGAGAVQAGSWTDGLFPENRFDFGMVPRGVKVKHDFQLVNGLGEPINILNLRPSCGCTSGRAVPRLWGQVRRPRSRLKWIRATTSASNRLYFMCRS